LRVPAEFLRRLGHDGGLRVAVGPHSSATPGPTLRKLDADIAVRGECEEVIAALADARDWRAVPSIAYLADDGLRTNGVLNASAFCDHASLRWPDEWI